MVDDVSKHEVFGNAKGNEERGDIGQSANRPSRIEDVHNNYDTVLKDSISLFRDKAIDFYGLDQDVRILEPLRTEKAEVTVDVEYSDLTFQLSNGKGLHLEVEATLSHDDLLRFCGYHVDLTREYKREFITVIFTKISKKRPSINHGMLKFKPHVIRHKDYDADAIPRASLITPFPPSSLPFFRLASLSSVAIPLTSMPPSSALPDEKIACEYGESEF